MKNSMCLFCNNYVLSNDIKLRRILNNNHKDELFMFSCSNCYKKEVMK